MRYETILQRAADTRAVFTDLWPEIVRADAGRAGSLSGKTLSVKDLFDVAGQVTRSGSRILDDRPAAQADAVAVARLRAQGAVMIGRTSMTELAYSGLGLNPHDGTPDNPLFPGCIPGGSSSGGAVSVALGIADLALGSDTGGSLRIPAAFCGITGFKPTAASVPGDGAIPLSPSLDSIGPMARDVGDCARAWQVMAGLPVGAPELHRPHLVVPQNFGLTELDKEIEEAFYQLISDLRRHGWTVEEKPLPVLEAYSRISVWHFSAVESHRRFGERISQMRHALDPRVLARIDRAAEVSDAAYETTVSKRNAFITAMRGDLRGATLLLPTVAMLPPTLAKVERDFDRINLLALRNASLANVMDGCSISVPYCGGNAPIGVMLTANGGRDMALLGAAAQLEADLGNGVE